MYPLFIGRRLVLTSLLIVTSVTKFPGIVESLFLLSLAPRPKVSKAWGFAIDKLFNSTWC